MIIVVGERDCAADAGPHDQFDGFASKIGSGAGIALSDRVGETRSRRLVVTGRGGVPDLQVICPTGVPDDHLLD